MYDGTFNGLHVERIIAVTTTRPTAGVVRATFRVLGGSSPESEKRLRLNEPALLTLCSQEIEGTLIDYSAKGRRLRDHDPVED